MLLGFHMLHISAINKKKKEILYKVGKLKKKGKHDQNNSMPNAKRPP